MRVKITFVMLLLLLVACKEEDPPVKYAGTVEVTSRLSAGRYQLSTESWVSVTPAVPVGAVLKTYRCYPTATTEWVNTGGAPYTTVTMRQAFGSLTCLRVE
jgi:hypothetical protein